jgi:SAM-dependent methyltransferase
MEGTAWSFRRLHCPVDKDALVLEVGSGGSPYSRANVLCDAYLDTRERHFAPLVHDRPTVLAFVENLPFRDDAFDFVIASHVLEHSLEPERFLAEIQRVGRAGYIEVPDAFMERLSCYLDHRLEITERDGELMITKKRAHVHDADVYELFRHKAHESFPTWVERRPFDFHVRYYWSRTGSGQPLRYRITNPEVRCDWQVVEEQRTSDHRQRRDLKHLTLLAARRLLSQHGRNAQLDIRALLRCPGCAGTELRDDAAGIRCATCNRQYASVASGIFDFTHEIAS